MLTFILRAFFFSCFAFLSRYRNFKYHKSQKRLNKGVVFLYLKMPKKKVSKKSSSNFYFLVHPSRLYINLFPYTYPYQQISKTNMLFLSNYHLTHHLYIRTFHPFVLFAYSYTLLKITIFTFSLYLIIFSFTPF